MMLSGCWSSAPPLFRPSEAVGDVIAEGRYVLRDPAEPGGPIVRSDNESLLVRVLSDRSLRVTEHTGKKSSTGRVLVIPQPTLPLNHYLLQVERPQHFGDHDALYVILDAGRLPMRIVILPCNGDAARMAEQTGGIVSRDPNSAAGCQYRDRATLIAALKQVNLSDDISKNVLELVRIASR